MNTERAPHSRNTRSRGYGDGTIIRLGPDRYRIQVSGGCHPVTGRRIRLCAHASTMEEARQKKALLLAQRHQPGRVVSFDRGITVSAWLDRFIEGKRDNERTHYFRVHKAAPVKTYLGSKRLHHLTAADVDRLVNQTLRGSLSQRTRHHVLSVLRRRSERRRGTPRCAAPRTWQRACG